ncbi:MAG: hypothetical protein BWY22_00735 [Bacteroidetes bacterium ADurb.Bin217]|nr:MAG: hypothetical protein BWY22_00735 [Bacteroidetes bacterium ADurb.Bin217]
MEYTVCLKKIALQKFSCNVFVAHKIDYICGIKKSIV